MTYTVTNTRQSASYTITDGLVNSELDIGLVGKGVVTYGQTLNTNYLKLLENFSNSTAPPKPIQGQLWYKNTDQSLYVYSGTDFISINPSVRTNQTIGNILLQSSTITGQIVNANLNIGTTGSGYVTTSNFGITGTTTTKVLYTAANGSVQSTGMTYNPTGDTLTVTSLNATNIAGTLTTAAQTAITSVGTLNNLAVTGGVLLATSSGNVGINTPTPTAKLQVTTAAQGIDGIVVQNGTQSLTLRPNSSSGASNPIVQTGDTALIYTTGIGTGNFVIAPWNNSLSGIRLDSSGNVGIGVSSPSSFLHLSKTTASGTYRTEMRIDNQDQRTTLASYYQSGVAQKTILRSEAISSGAAIPISFELGVTEVGRFDTSGTLSLTGGSGGAQLKMWNGGDLVIYNAANTGGVTLYCDTDKQLLSSGSIVPNTNGTLDLGTTSLRWNTIWGKASSATYADLAENYEADRSYEPGTVVEFGGEFEITEAKANSTRVAGIVSTNPGYLMNSEAKGNFIIPIGLVGRVPCKVVGPVFKGDMMVSAGDGYAIASSAPDVGTVIGKALENLAGGVGVIEVVVGRC